MTTSELAGGETICVAMIQGLWAVGSDYPEGEDTDRGVSECWESQAGWCQKDPSEAECEYCGEFRAVWNGSYEIQSDGSILYSDATCEACAARQREGGGASFFSDGHYERMDCDH